MNAGISQAQIRKAVETLRFVVDLSNAQPEELNVALCRFAGTFYPSSWFAADVLEVADELARALGFADSSLEPAS